MLEDGLLEVVPAPPSESSGRDGNRYTLTWKGHEFLDVARDLTRWHKVKAIVGKLGSAPFSIWMRVLHDLMLKEVGVAS